MPTSRAQKQRRTVIVVSGLVAATSLGLGIPASAATDGAESEEDRVAVISPTLDLANSGNQSGLPLVTGAATSVIANQLPGASEQPQAEPVLGPVREALLVPGEVGADVSGSGAREIDEAQELVEPLAPLNPVGDPVVSLAGDTLASLGNQVDEVSSGPYGTTLRELAALVLFFQSGE